MSEALRDDEAAAARWVASMDAGNWSDADERSLQSWLQGDRMRSGILLRAQAIWEMAAPPDRADTPAGATSARGWPRRAALGGLAASVVLAAGMGVRSLTLPKRYATDLGELRKVPLQDGSVVTMNSQSALAVRIEPSERRVALDTGEAWFDVAKDRARPFTVTAGGVHVRAVGTAFSVRILPGGTEIVVSEGRVEAWMDGSPDRSMLIDADQRLTLSTGDHASLHTPVAVDPRRALAWRDGLIELSGEALADATAEFNRYNARKIVIDDQRIAREQLNGVFKTTDPVGFATAAGKALDVPVDLGNDAVIVIG